MTITRRQVFALGAGVAAVAITGLPRVALAEEDKVQAAIDAFSGGATPETANVTLTAPEIAENGNIVAYDHSQWDPSHCSYWDTGFRADLRNLNDGKSHTSYANQLLMGDRLISWNDTASSGNVVHCLRGTEEGVVNDDVEEGQFTRSPVLDFMGPSGAYHANTLWGDFSITNIQNFYPANSIYEERISGYENGLKKDNIFSAEFQGAPDANGNPSNLLSGDNYLCYSYLVGTPDFPMMLGSWDELYD